jgi:hypothetical protein
MGDVVTALARAVAEEGHSVEVIVPKYDCGNYSEARGCALGPCLQHVSCPVLPCPVLWLGGGGTGRRLCVSDGVCLSVTGHTAQM